MAGRAGGQPHQGSAIPRPAPTSLPKRGISLAASVAMIVALGILPQPRAEAAPQTAPPVRQGSAAPASTPASASTAPITEAVALRAPASVTVPTLSTADARAHIDRLLASERATQTAASKRTTVTTQKAKAAAQKTKAAQAQQQANARLQQAMDALAKALSTSQCSNASGANGQSSISCPLANGGSASVSGTGNTTVTAAEPTSTATSDPSATPTASASTTAAPEPTATATSAAPTPDQTSPSPEPSPAPAAPTPTETTAAPAPTASDPTTTAPATSAPAPTPTSTATTAQPLAAGGAIEAVAFAAITPIQPTWIVSGTTATLTLTAAQAADGRLSLDPATQSIVFVEGDQTQSVSLVGLTTIVLTGIDGAASITVDLSGLLPDQSLAVTVDVAPSAVTLVTPTADALLTAGDSGWLKLDSAAATVAFRTPTESLFVKDASGTVTLAGDAIATAGADLSVTARAIVVAPGTAVDTSSDARTGDISLAAVDTSPQGASASLTVDGATLTGRSVTLTASASPNEQASTSSSSSSAKVDVRDVRVAASGDVKVASSSTLNGRVATPAGAVAASSISTARVAGRSTVTARGQFVLRADNRADVAVSGINPFGVGLAGADLVRITSAILDGSASVSAASITVSAQSAGSVSLVSSGVAGAAPQPAAGPATVALAYAPTAGGVAAGRVRTSTEAGLAPNASLSAGGAAVTISAGSALDASVVAHGGLGALVLEDSTVARLGDDSVLSGAGDVTVAATTTHHATVDADLAVLSSNAATDAVVGTGSPLALQGNLTVTADQDATATATGARAALTIARHWVTVSVGRAVSTPGSITLASTGGSSTRTFVAAGVSGAPTSVALAVASALGGLPLPLGIGLTTGAAAAVPAVNAVDALVRTVLGNGSPIDAGGSIVLQAVAGGSAGAGSGRDLAITQAAAVNLATFSGLVDVNSAVFARGDIAVLAARGPPAETTPTSTDSTTNTLDYLTRTATVHRTAAAVVNSPTGSVTIQDDTTALPLPSQAIFTPPPGSVLVTAAAGGSLTAGQATLTFAPGALPTDAWVTISSHSGDVAGLHTTSAIFDLHAYDARTGAVISTFVIAPELTIAVAPAEAGSAIYYVAADGSIQRQPTTYDPVAGTVTARLPHFSSYVSGSPLDALVSAILPQIQSWISSVPSTFPATFSLGSFTLVPGVTLSSVTLTLDSPGITGSTGSYSGTVSISATLAVSLGSGAFALTGGGTLAASYTLSAQAADAGSLTLSVTGFSLSASSGGTTVGSLSAGTATLTQTGSDLTFSQTGVTLTMGPLTLTGGALNLTSRASTGALDFQLTGGAVTLAGVTITNATASYTPAAGLTVGGTLALTVASQSLGGSVTVTNSGTALTLAITGLTAAFGTSAQSVQLTGGAGSLTRTSAGVQGSLTVAVAATGLISGTGVGSLTIDTTAATPFVKALVALRNVSVFVGQGPVWNPDGTVNPSARGLLVANATIGLDVVSAGASTDYAVDAQGDASLVGFPGIAASGRIRARVNSFTTAVDETIQFADGSGNVALLFTDGSSSTPVETGTLTTAFASYAGTGLSLTVLGQSLTADVTVTPTTTGLTASLANLSFVLGSQGAAVATFAASGPAGSLMLSGTAVAGSLNGTLTLAVPGVTVTGTVGLDVLTSSTPTDPMHVAITAAGVTVTVAGQQIGVATLTVQRVTTGGVSTTTLAVTGGHFTITQGSTDLLAVTGLAGSLAITADGVSGHLSATVTSSFGGLAFGSAVTLGVNTGAAAVGDLPAGPFVRVEASGATITIGSQSLTADLVFTRGLDAAGNTEARVAVAHAALSLGGAIVVSDGTGGLILTSSGIAAQLSGSVSVTVPAVQLSGTLQVQLNTTGAPVNDTVHLGSGDVPVVVPAGTGAYVQVVGTGVVLTVGGQQLTGDVTFTSTGTSVTVALANASLNLGGGLATLTGATASLTAGSAGLYGSFTGTLALAIPGVTASGTVSVQVNTTSAAQGTIPAGAVRIGGTNLTVGFAGTTLTGEIWFEKVGTGAGTTYQVDLVSAGLTLGAFASLSGATGTFVLSAAGVAGSVSATPTFTLPSLVTLTGGTTSLQINTTGAQAVAGSVTLPAGPYLRLELDGATLNVATTPGGSLTGSFAFQQSVSGGVTETILGFTGVQATLGGSSSVGLYNGTGAVVLRSGGVAGYVSGTTSASTAGISMSGSVILEINTTGTIVDTSIVVGSSTLAVKFPTTDQVFNISVSNASITIADFVSIQGNVSFSDTSLTLSTNSTIAGSAVQAQVFAGTGLTVFLGRGPAKLDTGAINPLAMGVLLSDARIGLISVNGGYALVATGTLSLLGVNGVTLTGTTSVRVNTTGYVIDQTLTIPGSTDPGVVLQFGGDPTTHDAVQTLQFAVTGATLALGDVALTGDLSFSRDGTGVLASVANASIALAGGVSLTSINGSVLFGTGGVAASLTAHVVVPALGVNLDGALALNTTTAPVTVPLGTSASTVDLPAGPYVRAQVTGAALSVLGQSLTADVAVQRATAPDGSATVLIALNNVGLTLGAGLANTQTVGITGGSGLLALVGTGFAGRVTGTITANLGTDVQLAGTLTLALNTTAAPVNASLTVGGVAVSVSVPAGPYLRFEGTGITVTVMGQTLTGDVAIEKTTPLTSTGTPDATKSELRLTASNVSLTLGGTQPIVSLTGGTALAVLTGTAGAGRITGTLAVAIPGIALSGALAVEFNTGTTAVDETFSVGAAVPQTLNLPAAGAGGAYVQVRGTGVSLSILGQTLSGDVSIVRTGGTSPAYAITTANLVLKLGGTGGAPVLTATQVPATTGTFTVSAGALSGSIAVAVALAVPGVALSGTVTVAFDTALKSFTLGGTGLTFTAFGQSLGGDFTFDQQTDASGAAVVRVGVANATLALGPTLSPVVSATGGTGVLVVTPTSFAGSLAATISVGSGTPVTLAGAVSVQLNTSAAPVNELVNVGAGSLALALPAGPYLRIAGTGVTLTVGGQSLVADVAIEKTTSYGPDGIAGTPDDSSLIRIAATNVSLALGDGTNTLLSLTGGTAAFVLPATGGLAGQIGGTVNLTGVPGVQLSATFSALVNTTASAVHESFLVGGAVLTVDVAANTPFQVTAKSVALTLGALTLRGDLQVTKTTAALTLVVSNGTLAFGSASTPLVRATAIAGTFTVLTAGLYGQATAALAVDAPGLGVSGSVSLTLNTTGAVQGAIQTGVSAQITSPTLTIGGLTLGAASLSVRRDAAGASVIVSVVDLTMDFGSVVHVATSNHASGTLVVTAAGVAGSFSIGSVAGMFVLPSSGTLTGSVAVQVNTGAAALVRPDLALDLPAGPYLRVSVTGATLTIGGVAFQGTFQLTQDLTPAFASTPSTIGTSAVTAFALADANGDGRPDLLIGSASGATLFLAGTTAGSYAAGTTFSGGTGAVVGVAIADVSSDGKPDILLVRGGASGSSAVYLGTGPGTFASGAVTFGTPNATSFVLGDVTGDGLPDVVVGAGTSGVTVFADQGSTTTWQGLSAVTTASVTDAKVSGVALADLNHDGLPDLVVVNNGADQHVYTNKGTASSVWQGFDVASVTILSTPASAVAAADVNGDGWVDVIVANTGAAAKVYLNKAFSGSVWAGLDNTGVAVGDSSTATTVAVGDVNGDGLPDVVLGSAAGASLYLNKGTDVGGTWARFRTGKPVSGALGASAVVGLANVLGGAAFDLVAADATVGLDAFAYQPTRRTLVGFTGVSVSLTPTGGSGIGVSGGQGAFLVLPSGLAGTFTGTISVAGGTFSAGAQVAVRYNGTTSTVDETVLVGGVAVPITFGSGEVASSSAFIAATVSGALTFGPLEIVGTFSFSGGNVLVSSVSIFLGQGPGFLADKSVNPLARGIFLLNAAGAITGNSGSRALAVGGTLVLAGFPGVTLGGTVNVFFNEASGTTLAIGPTTYTLPVGTPSSPFVKVVGDVTLAVGGQALTGTVAFETLAGGGLRLSFGTAATPPAGSPAANPLSLNLGGGAVVATVATGTLDITPAGVAASLTVSTLTFAASSGFSFSAGGSLQVNTTNAERVVDGTTIAARTLRVVLGTQSAPATLTIGGQSLSGIFAFSQITGTLPAGSPPGSQPPTTAYVAATAVSLSIAGGAVTVSDGSGLFVINSAGVAGRLQGTVAVTVPGNAVGFAGTFTVAVNSTNARVQAAVALGTQTTALDLPAGPYLRVEGTGITVTMGGQTFGGDVSFVRATNASLAVVTEVSFANVTAGFGDGTTNVLTLTGGTGAFLLDGTGLAGRLSGTVTVSVPGVGVTGTLGLVLNTTATHVVDSLTVGSTIINLDIPSGPYLELTGTGLSLTLAGVSVAGDLTFTQTGAGAARVVTLSIANGSLTLGTLAPISFAGDVLVTRSGVAARLALSVSTLALGDVSATGTFTLELNSSGQQATLASGVVPAGPFVRVSGTGIVLTFGASGPQLTASVSVQRTTNSLGQARVVVAVAGGSLSLDGSTTILSGVQGLFVLAPAGLAGQVGGTIDLAGLLPSSVSLSGNFALTVNRTGLAVSESVVLGGTTVSLALAAGTYTKVAATGVSLALAGQTLTGDASFVRNGTSTQLSFAHVALSLGGGIVTASDGSGTFSFDGTGASRALYGTLAITVGLNVPQVTLSGSLSLAINTSSTLTLGGIAPSSFSVGGLGLTLAVAGQQVSGDLTFSQTTSNGQRVVRVSAANVMIFLGDPSGRGVRLTGGTGNFLLTPAGVAASVGGTLALVGMSDLPVSFGATVTLRVNTMVTAVNDSVLGLSLPAGPYLRLGLDAATVTLFGQSLSGSFSFEQSTDAGPDGVLSTTDDRKVLKFAAADVGLFLGSGGVGVTVTGGSALLVIAPQGIAGRISGTATLALGPLGSASASVVVTVNQFQQVSTGGVITPLAVNETFVVGGTSQRLVLSAGRYVTASLTGLSLSLGGQRFTTDLSVEYRAHLNTDGTLPTTRIYDTTVGFANLGLRLGTAERDIVVVSNGSGTLTILGGAGGGVFGGVTVTVAVDIPGVTFGGTFQVLVNTTTAPQTVASTTVAATSLAVVGTGISMTVLGQTLTGNFAFAKSGQTLTLALTNVVLALGDGTTTFVTATIANGVILVTPAGVSAVDRGRAVAQQRHLLQHHPRRGRDRPVQQHGDRPEHQRHRGQRDGLARRAREHPAGAGRPRRTPRHDLAVRPEPQRRRALRADADGHGLQAGPDGLHERLALPRRRRDDPGRLPERRSWAVPGQRLRRRPDHPERVRRPRRGRRVDHRPARVDVGPPFPAGQPAGRRRQRDGPVRGRRRDDHDAGHVVHP